MDSDALCNLSLSELASQLRGHKLSSVEATRCVLERIKNLNPRLHAYLTVTDELALRQAAQADSEIGAGKWRGPLHGVPIAVKDLCQTRGVLTTCSSRVLRDWRPDANATVVDRLDAAGAVLLGKLNLTEFAMGWYHPEIPAPLNPWGAEFWPGASSSGSGVATAAALCFASLGTDTGGSIRLPSAACGVVGLKPTWGRVSRHGVFPLGESFDHIGPMTRTVADAAHVLAVIAGHDPADETSLAAPVDDYAAALERGVKGLRVGLDEKYLGEGSDPKVAAAVLEAIRTLERLGARVVKVTIPDVNPCMGVWMTLCSAEAAAAHQATFPKQAADYGPGFRSFLEIGVTVSGQDYAKGHMIREAFANRFNAMLEEVDIFACPSLPVASLPVDSVPPTARELTAVNPLLRFTAPFNMSRNPTLSMPCGASASGAPPSLQLIGRRLGEAALIQAGEAFERATDWHKQRPPMAK
ncbi:MAG TPA: amidase [Candidatus Binataceae bacterium]|nr:amidase [Candidatus Binataceae bacterium]